MIAIRQKLSFQSRPWADWYFNHSSVFLVWSSSQSQGWIFCSKFKTCPRWYVKILDFGQNIHPCDWYHDQTINTLQWLKYQSALGLDRKRNFCLIAITIVPEEYLNRGLKTADFSCLSLFFQVSRFVSFFLNQSLTRYNTSNKMYPKIKGCWSDCFFNRIIVYHYIEIYYTY